MGLLSTIVNAWTRVVNTDSAVMGVYLLLSFGFLDGSFQFPQSDVSPLDGGGRIAFEGVDLQGNEAGGGHGVGDVGDGDVVDPGFDGGAEAADVEGVPLIGDECFLCGGIGAVLGEPSASGLVVDEAGVAVGRDFDLVTKDVAVFVIG